MNEEISNKLDNLITSANTDFLDMIAILEVLGSITEFDTPSCSTIYLAQRLVRKVFNQMNRCKRLLGLI